MAEETLTVNSDVFPQLQKSSSIVVNQTYSWINNSQFYSAVNPSYYLYYQNNVRRMAYWLDGWNPYFHNEQNGIFSTRFSNALVNSLGDAIFGRELMFKNAGVEKDANLDNTSLKSTSKWAKLAEFQEASKKALKYALGLGTSLVKLNIAKGKELWCEAVRLDYFYFEVDSRNRIKEVTCLLKGYSNLAGSKDSGTTDNYYLVEKRFFKFFKETTFQPDASGIPQPIERLIEQPYVTYQVHKYNGNALTNNAYNASTRETVRWDSVPKKVRESIKNDYSTLRIGEDQELPFNEHLGAYLVTADEGNISLPNIPFGTSILENIISYLMGIDISYSYFFRDMYQGKGIVLIPKKFQQPKAKQGDAVYTTPFSNLDESMFTQYDSISTEDKPGMIEKVQFDLRGQEWAGIRSMLIENISMTLQISPRTIASFLTAGAIQTATQVSSEDSATISFVETHRSTFEKPLNKMLKDVCEFYGWNDTVEIRYSKEGVINKDQLLQRLSAEKAAGFTNDYDALRDYMYDSDEEQVKERYERNKQEQMEKMQMQMAMTMGEQPDQSNAGEEPIVE